MRLKRDGESQNVELTIMATLFPLSCSRPYTSHSIPAITIVLSEKSEEEAEEEVMAVEDGGISRFQPSLSSFEPSLPFPPTSINQETDRF